MNDQLEIEIDSGNRALKSALKEYFKLESLDRLEPRLFKLTTLNAEQYSVSASSGKELTIESIPQGNTAGIGRSFQYEHGKGWLEKDGTADKLITSPIGETLYLNGFEIASLDDPVLGEVVSENCRAAIKTNGMRSIEMLKSSTSILRNDLSHAFFRPLFNISRTIVVYDSNESDSFATLQAHGALFVNIRNSNNSIELAVDCVHQATHCMLNQITLNKTDLFAHPHDTLMSNLDGTNDNRSLYSVFHGIFTAAAEVLACKDLEQLKLNDMESKSISNTALKSINSYHRDISKLENVGAINNNSSKLLELISWDL